MKLEGAACLCFALFNDSLSAASVIKRRKTMRKACFQILKLRIVVHSYQLIAVL
jgi:hypothetical protein